MQFTRLSDGDPYLSAAEIVILDLAPSDAHRTAELWRRDLPMKLRETVTDFGRRKNLRHHPSLLNRFVLDPSR